MSDLEIQKAEKKEEYKDCLPCKLTGAAAFGGLGAYALREASKLHKMPGKQGTAVGLGVAGVGKNEQRPALSEYCSNKTFCTVFVSAGLYRLML